MRYIFCVLIFLICFMPARSFAYEYSDESFSYTSEAFREVSETLDFGDFVSSVVKGDDPLPEGIFQKIVAMVIGDVKSVLSYILSVLGFVILSSCIKGSQIKLGESVSEIAFLICYFVISTFLIGILYKSVGIALKAAEEIVVFIRMSLPAYIGIISSTGINASAMQGVFLMMVNAVSQYAGDFMINSFFYIGVLTIVSNMSSRIQIMKLIHISRQVLLWALGFLLTVFAGMTSLSGLAVSASSATGIRAAKYTIGHAIPVVGGFLADSTELILASAKIFKNALGTAGIIALAILCLVPVLKLFAVGFTLKITAGLTEPFCDKLMSDSIYAVGQTVVYIMVSVLLMTVMFIFAFAVLMNL